MDRDRRWDRTKRAYDAIVHGVGARADDPVAAVRASYEARRHGRVRRAGGDRRPVRGPRPATATRSSSSTSGPTVPGSWSRALIEPGFAEFDRGADPPRPHLVQMTEYAEDVRRAGRLPVGVAGRRAGGRRSPPPVSSSCMSPRPRSTPTSPTSSTAAASTAAGVRSGSWCNSPRDVPTYDQKPAMSAPEVARVFSEGIASGELRVRPGQLCQRRHGRPHRRDPGRGRGRRDGRPLPGPGAGGGAGGRRRVPGHRRPRQRRADAAARRIAAHRPHHQSGAGGAGRWPGIWLCERADASPTWRRPCCSCWASTSPRRWPGCRSWCPHLYAVYSHPRFL